MDNETRSKEDNYKICAICGENHLLQNCCLIPVKRNVFDKEIPSKARLTLPEGFEIRTLADASCTIYTLIQLEQGVRFGPIEANKMCTLLPQINFPLKVFSTGDEDLTNYYLDTSNEYKCNWMCFIQAANSFQEQNLLAYEEERNIYYVTIRDIDVGEELKVWYSPHYATKMKKGMLIKPVPTEGVPSNTEFLDDLVKRKNQVRARDNWSCKFCGKLEHKLTKFAEHLVHHYNLKLKKTCELCNTTFRRQQTYKKHIKLVHNSEASSQLLPEQQKKSSQVINKTEKSKDHCVGGPLLLNDITAESLDNLNNAQYSSLENDNVIVPQTVLSQFDLNQSNPLENENLNVDSILNENVKQLEHFNFEINEPENEQLICDICFKVFGKIKNLVTHLNQHTGKFNCRECFKVFTRKENLTYHSCNSYYRMKCPLCESVFVQQKALTYHIKYVHDKKFACGQCYKHYSNKEQLDSHACNSKQIKKMHPCDVCKKEYAHKKNLMMHMKVHKDIVETLTCPTCGASFNTKRACLRHTKIHEGFRCKCNICQKVFNRKDSLSYHQKIAHGNNTDTCEVCGKQLASKKLLKMHMETHRTDRPYQCTYCDATFKLNTSLVRHVKRHKNKNIDHLIKMGTFFFSCPKCPKQVKHRFSMRRHIKFCHPEFTINVNKLKPIRTDERTPKDTVEDSVLDLKQTIDNMDFNTDEVNNCSDINIEIDKILNGSSIFLSDSADRIVESLIDDVVKEGNLDHAYEQKMVCLSMPDLSNGDQGIKSGETEHTLDESRKKSPEVILYVLNGDKLS